MKRIISLLLAALLALSFLSCAAPGGNSDPTGEGSDNEFYTFDFCGSSGFSGRQQIFETEDSVYYLCRNQDEVKKEIKYTVWVSDKTNKDWLPLCGRPNCLHDDKECNSLLEASQGGRIWLYGSHIYYSVDYLSLWRMKLDGSEHEEVYTFDRETMGRIGMVFFHNKYLIIMGTGPEEDEVEFPIMHAYVLDLSENMLEPREIELISEDGANYFGTTIAGEGRYLYTALDDGRLIRFDLEACTHEMLCTLPFCPDDWSAALEGDELYIFDPWNSGLALKVNKLTGDIVSIKEAEPETEYWLTPANGFVVGVDYYGTNVYDYNCELVAKIPNAADGVMYSAEWILSGVVYGYEYVDGSEAITTPPQWYLDLNEIGSPDMTWHKWAPED